MSYYRFIHTLIIPVLWLKECVCLFGHGADEMIRLCVDNIKEKLLSNLC